MQMGVVLNEPIDDGRGILCRALRWTNLGIYAHRRVVDENIILCNVRGRFTATHPRLFSHRSRFEMAPEREGFRKTFPRLEFVEVL